jgi:multimeric flavodoxin WrbA
LEILPEKLGTPEIPYFRQKPVMLMVDGFSLFFKEIDKLEYWISEQHTTGSFLVQWIEIKDSKPQPFHRKLSNRKGLEIENNKRDTSLAKHLFKKVEIEKNEILDYLEEVGVYVSENRLLLPPLTGTVGEEDDLKRSEPEEISEEQMSAMVKLLERPDLLSFIDQALYERKPESGFIIGEIESKHVLNFNCVGARLGVATINTLKGASSIGKTNTANIVTGLHRTKKVGSLSDTALKYAKDMDNIDVLYIQETCEDEFKTKETRLMSDDDEGFIAETTIKNPETNEFEVQRTVIPVKTLVTTTTAMELDPEFATRNFIIPVDDSEEQTKRIIEENFKTTEKKLQERNNKTKFNHKYDQLKEAFTILKEYDVLIPFESDLFEIFPTSNPQTRRDSKKLIKLISCSALLFQYQRCRSESEDENFLVASWVDLVHALVLGAPILEATLTGFDKRLLDTLPVINKLIDDDGHVTTNSLAKKIKRSTKYAWQILKFFEDNGFIYHDNDTKTKYGIKGKAKVYIKSEAEKYENLLLLIGNINWPNIKNKEEYFIKKQIPNSPHQVSDVIYLPKYDQKKSNKVVYNQYHVQSKEFGIYSNTINTVTKTEDTNPEILIEKSRIENKDKHIKQATNAEIDYKNLTVLESAILSELVNFIKHTYKSIIDVLKPSYPENDIYQTLITMEDKGWIE